MSKTIEDVQIYLNEILGPTHDLSVALKLHMESLQTRNETVPAVDSEVRCTLISLLDCYFKMHIQPQWSFEKATQFIRNMLTVDQNPGTHTFKNNVMSQSNANEAIYQRTLKVLNYNLSSVETLYNEFLSNRQP